MFNEFVRVTEKHSKEKFLINLSDISFIREKVDKGTSILKLRSNEKLFLHVKESFESFESFFEELKEDS